jgi:hypothetical protein
MTQAQNRWVTQPADAPSGGGGHELPPISSLEVVSKSDPDLMRAVVPPPLTLADDASVHLRFTDIDPGQFWFKVMPAVSGQGFDCDVLPRLRARDDHGTTWCSPSSSSWPSVPYRITPWNGPTAAPVTSVPGRDQNKLC